MLATMAGWFGKDGPKPVAASELGLPTQSAPGVAAEPPAEPDTRRAAEAPRRRRGAGEEEARVLVARLRQGQGQAAAAAGETAPPK